MKLVLQCVGRKKANMIFVYLTSYFPNSEIHITPNFKCSISNLSNQQAMVFYCNANSRLEFEHRTTLKAHTISTPTFGCMRCIGEDIYLGGHGLWSYYDGHGILDPKKDDSNVATIMNYGVAASSSWSKCICNPEMGIRESEGSQ